MIQNRKCCGSCRGRDITNIELRLPSRVGGITRQIDRVLDCGHCGRASLTRYVSACESDGYAIDEGEASVHAVCDNYVVVWKSGGQVHGDLVSHNFTDGYIVAGCKGFTGAGDDLERPVSAVFTVTVSVSVTVFPFDVSMPVTVATFVVVSFNTTEQVYVHCSVISRILFVLTSPLT